MAYMHILNLYKQQEILLFKECYALEKIHGTSAHASFNGLTKSIHYFSGESPNVFVALFDGTKLLQDFINLGIPEDRKITVFGEFYGGKCQGMSETYGKVGKFVVFDVQIGDIWLDVPNAEQVVNKLGIEFVSYNRGPTTLEFLNHQRDLDSVQAIRNGMGPGKKREGVVIRPVIEVRLNNGNRIICKHKRDDFRETKEPRKVGDPSRLQVLGEASAIAEEWVTFQRLTHVLQKIPNHSIESMRDVILAMTEDVLREAEGEIVVSDAVKKAIGNKTAQLYKDYLRQSLTILKSQVI